MMDFTFQLILSRHFRHLLSFVKLHLDKCKKNYRHFHPFFLVRWQCMDKFWNNGNPKLHFTKEQHGTGRILFNILHILGVLNTTKGQFSIC